MQLDIKLTFQHRLQVYKETCVQANVSPHPFATFIPSEQAVFCHHQQQILVHSSHHCNQTETEQGEDNNDGWRSKVVPKSTRRVQLRLRGRVSVRVMIRARIRVRIRVTFRARAQGQFSLGNELTVNHNDTYVFCMIRKLLQQHTVVVPNDRYNDP